VDLSISIEVPPAPEGGLILAVIWVVVGKCAVADSTI
jgi:hypothetical protein